MTTKTHPFDLSAHLQTDENIREFLDIMLEENGTEGFEQALVHVAKTKGKKFTPNRWINKSGEYDGCSKQNG